MKKLLAKIVAIMMVAVAVIPGFTVLARAETIPEIPDYTGTPDVPHPISNKYELASIGSNQFGKEYPLNGNYIQTQDIVFTPEDFALGGDFYNEGKGWKPIGNESAKFSGKYNGGGNAIENIFINRPEEQYVGIFSWGDVGHSSQT